MQLYVSCQVTFTNLAAPLQLSVGYPTCHTFFPGSCLADVTSQLVHLTCKLPCSFLQQDCSPYLQSAIQLSSNSEVTFPGSFHTAVFNQLVHLTLICYAAVFRQMIHLTWKLPCSFPQPACSPSVQDL